MRTGLVKFNNADSAFSTVFDDFFRMVPGDIFAGDQYPTIDVHEDEKAVYLKAEIPGLDEKEIDITLKENLLTISGEKKEEKTEEDKNRNYMYCERRFGSFSRTIELPPVINPESVKASYKNGVLEIELAKSEAAKPKKITINVN